MEELKRLGLEENTLVILMADNGPMTHKGPAGMIEHLYRGGKGDFLEGGVRVPAIAKWEGVIEEGQVVGDMIHITDLFTTFANLAGAKEHIPTDRIIDGLDQTSLLLNGDSFGRRDYVFIYTGNILAATVKGRFKRHWVGELPGLSGASFFDLYNDPREVNGKMLPGFTTKGMFMSMKVRHELWKQKYPDVEMTRDFPFKGLENPSPAVDAASKPRIDPDKLPFDPREFIKALPGWEQTEELWGSDER
jgi:arylsulfatase